MSSEKLTKKIGKKAATKKRLGFKTYKRRYVLWGGLGG